MKPKYLFRAIWRTIIVLVLITVLSFIAIKEPIGFFSIVGVIVLVTAFYSEED